MQSFRLLRREMQQVPPKSLYPPATLQDITAQMNTIKLNFLSEYLACLLV